MNVIGVIFICTYPTSFACVCYAPKLMINPTSHAIGSPKL